jgi:hypothetical protein
MVGAGILELEDDAGAKCGSGDGSVVEVIMRGQATSCGLCFHFYPSSFGTSTRDTLKLRRHAPVVSPPRRHCLISNTVPTYLRYLVSRKGHPASSLTMGLGLDRTVSGLMIGSFFRGSERYIRQRRNHEGSFVP